MIRVAFLKLGDYEYPLVNSLYVAEQIEDIDDMQSVSALSKILEAMSFAGAKYLNIVGSPNKNLKRNNEGQILPLTSDEILFLIGIDESAIKEISNKISECFAIGEKKQVSANSKKKKKRH